MTTQVLSGVDLTCYRGDRCLFQNLNFQIQSKQLLLIEGRNGSGKTTLLKLICGLRFPDEGSIQWNHQPIDEVAEYRQHMVYVGHHDGVKRELTVAENLRLGQQLLPSKQTDITTILEQLHLLAHEDSLAATLSAGQRRRVALARILYSGVSLWILDEPFTALDKHTTGFFEDSLQTHLDAGGMVIMTSHQDLQISTIDIQRLVLGL